MPTTPNRTDATPPGPTGPRSEAGKATSRLNATAHGLRATLPLLPGEDEAAYLARRAAWIAELRPVGPAEMAQAELALAALIGVERCQRAEAAAARLRAANRRVEDAIAEARAVEDLAAGLPARPASARLALAATAAGCRWLADQWDALRRALEDTGRWDLARLARALDLLGIPRAAAFDDPTAHTLLRRAIALAPAASVEWPRERAAADVAELLAGAGLRPADLTQPGFVVRVATLLDEPPPPDQARAALMALASEQARALRRQAEEHEAARADLDLWRRDLDAVDTTREGALRQRYLAMHLRTHHRALAELRRLQSERTRPVALPDPAPLGALTPAPLPEPTSDPAALAAPNELPEFVLAHQRRVHALRELDKFLSGAPADECLTPTQIAELLNQS